MNKNCFVKSLLSLIAFLFLFGCATKESQLPPFTATQFDTGMYQSKVDNFVIVLDASSSMDYPYHSKPKFVTAKAIAERLNMTIPELGQTAGLRSFGHAKGVSKKLTELFYGMEEYNTDALADKLAMVTESGGTSPLGTALTGVGTDLEGLSGTRNAVVIISDGLDMEHKVEQAQALKDKYGSSICFYPILVGEDPDGEAFLQEIANIGDCGFLSKSYKLLKNKDLDAFVQTVFLEEMVAQKEPEPEPEKVVMKDSDGDGIYDAEDQCPGTPMGAKVNSAGCWTLGNVLFDTNKTVIKPEAYAWLDDVVEILKNNPAMSVEVQGHTDNVGSREYNMALSLKRAQAVAEYIAGKGILRNRMATTGFAFDKPVALNGTDFGRSLNRRVELHPY